MVSDNVFLIHFFRNLGGSLSSTGGTRFGSGGECEGPAFDDDGEIDKVALTAAFFRDELFFPVLPPLSFDGRGPSSTSISSSVALPFPFLSQTFDTGFSRGCCTSASLDGPASGKTSWPQLLDLCLALGTISTPLIPPDIGTRSLVRKPLSTPTSGPRSILDPLPRSSSL